MINLISNQYNRSSLISFKARIIPTKAQANYFMADYPLLAKYIPQHCFSIQKYDGTEFTRYLLTTGCSVCSKLSLYDKSQKIGLYSHVDSYIELHKSFNKIKKILFENKLDPKKLVAQDIPGVCYDDELKSKAIKSFLKQLGLKEDNIVQVPFDRENCFDGGILDLKDGRTYDVNSWIYDYDDFKKTLKLNINSKLGNHKKAFAIAMEQFKMKYTSYTSNSEYVEV